jgi:ribosome maturation factor RimP
MFKNTVQELLKNAMEERLDLFLIDLDVNENNAIKIIIDGDNGVSVDDCVFLSRVVEHSLDREEQDFSLEVTSAGATTPLQHARQYKKHIGRTLSIKTNEGEKYEASITMADDNGISLEWKTREPKPVGKGKVTVLKQAEIAYNDIKEAKVKIKF